MFRVSLCLLFLATSSPVQINSTHLVQSQKSEDCEICGHACCCPEQCAAELKARQKKQSRCDQPAANCRVGKSDQPIFWGDAADEIRFRPAVDFTTPILPLIVARTSAPENDALLMGLSPSQEIPTPPPKLIA